MSKYTKFIVAVIGAVGVAISEGLLPGSATAIVNVIVAFLTAIGVYVAPNAD